MIRTKRFAILLLFVASATFAQERREPPPGRSFPVQQRLRTADALIEPVIQPQDLAILLSGFTGTGHPLAPFASLALAKSENYEQAYEEYRRILRSTPEALVAPRPLFAADQAVAVAYRHVFHHRISRMPPSILQRYRDEVDADAKALWDVAEAEHSMEPLLRIAEEFFASRHADVAIARLGDLAFQAGRFEEAQAWWRRLAAPVDESPTPTMVPYLRFDPALIRAKQILADVFQGKLEAAERKIVLFRKQHPDSNGTLAGGQGSLAAILAAQIRLREKHLAADLDLDWSTFGGNTHRNRVLATTPPASMWRDGPIWRTTIPASRDLMPVGTPRQPPLHPVIAGERVYLTDGRFVAAYDLFNGKEMFRFAPHRASEEANDAGGWSRPSVTVHEGRVFAVLRPESRMLKNDSVAVNALHAIDSAGKLLWKLEGKTPDGQLAVFDPSPLAVGSRLFLTMRRSHAGRTKTWIVACDLEGRVRWMQELAETNEPEHDPGRPPLVWAADRVVHLSNAGWAAALHPRTGEQLWAVRYGEGKPREGKTRSEGALLYAEGCVVMAPADQPRVFGVDAAEGRLLWSLPIEATDLVGASSGRAFVATKLGMESVELRTGEGRRRWRQPAEGRLSTVGRGLLAGGWIFWPTADPQLPWRTLTHTEGLPQKPLTDGPLHEPNYFDPVAMFRVPAGETAFGQGCMAIATSDELVVYIPNRRLAPKLLPEARDDRPDVLYRLAAAYREEGRPTEAATFLARLLANVPTAERDQWGLLWERHNEPREPLTSRGEWKLALQLSKPVERLGGFPLEKSWSRWIEGRMIVASDAASGHYFISHKNRISAGRIESGETAWSFESDSPFDFVETTDGRTIFAGPDGVQARTPATGELLWSFENPTSPGLRLQHGKPTASASVERLNDVLVLNDRATFRIGNRTLVQLDEASGKVAFVGKPAGEAGDSLGGRIFLSPIEGALDPRDYIVEFNSDASRHRIAEFEPNVYSTRLAEEALAVGLAGGQVEYRHRSGKVRWTFRPDSPASLTGEAARIFPLRESFLVLVPRNLGDEWLRLDAKTGEIAWKLEAGAFREPLDLDGMLIDHSQWYVCTRDALEARSLRTGQKVWRTALPSGFAGWRPVRTKHGVLVCPVAKPSKPELCGPPNPEPRLKDSPSEAPILLFDATDGQAMQRVAVPYRGGPIDVQVGAQWLLVGTGGTLHSYRCRGDMAKR